MGEMEDYEIKKWTIIAILIVTAIAIAWVLITNL